MELQMKREKLTGKSKDRQIRHLVLIGEVGGEEGAGTSFSSSSSSPHSSSLSGVILFPNHMECIETLQHEEKTNRKETHHSTPS